MTAKPLSAAEEAKLRGQVTDPDGPPFFECADLDRVFRLLDASRAETAAVVRERDEMVALLTDPVAVHLNMLRGGIARPSVANIVHLYQGAVVDASLAADLVEGLAGLVARYGDFAPGKPFIFPPNHHIDLARALLTRAAALGVGKPQDGEKENG